MKPAFVIVDMQPETFGLASSKRLVNKINDMSYFFMTRQLPIVLVTFVGCGRTHKAIYSKLKGYKNLIIVKKYDCDGGKVIHLHTKRKKITHFVFSGIYRCQCVLESARTLATMTNSSIVMTNGIAGCSPNDCYDCRKNRTANEFVTSDKKLKELLSQV